jgi:hypothetical protein
MAAGTFPPQPPSVHSKIEFHEYQHTSWKYITSLFSHHVFGIVFSTSIIIYPPICPSVYPTAFLSFKYSYIISHIRVQVLCRCTNNPGYSCNAPEVLRGICETRPDSCLRRTEFSGWEERYTPAYSIGRTPESM